MATTLGYSGAALQESLITTVQLAQADINNLPFASYILVPAPGANYLNRLIRCEIQTKIIVSWVPGAAAVLEVFQDDPALTVLASLPNAELATLMTTGAIRFTTLSVKINVCLSTTQNDKSIKLRINGPGFSGGGHAADLMIVRTCYVVEPLIRITF